MKGVQGLEEDPNTIAKPFKMHKKSSTREKTGTYCIGDSAVSVGCMYLLNSPHDDKAFQIA